MKRFVFALAVTLAMPAALAAQAFQGTLQQHNYTVLPQGVAALAAADTSSPQAILAALAGKVKGGDASYVNAQTATITIKGKKMRVDGLSGGATGAGGYVIMDAAAGMMYTVMPQQKRIMVVSMEDAAAIAKRMIERMGVSPAPSAGQANAAPTRTDLGTRVVDGVKAHGYRLTTAEGAGEVWVDPARVDPFAPFNAMQQKFAAMSGGAGQIQAAMQGLGFPLRMEFAARAPAMIGQGWIYGQSETSGMQKQPVSDDLFKLPADYTQVNMAQAMGIKP